MESMTRIGLGEGLVEERKEGVDQPGCNAGAERVLVFEIEVEGALAELDRVGDRVHSEGVVSVRGDELLGRVENRLPTSRSLPLPARCNCQLQLAPDQTDRRSVNDYWLASLGPGVARTSQESAIFVIFSPGRVSSIAASVGVLAFVSRVIVDPASSDTAHGTDGRSDAIELERALRALRRGVWSERTSVDRTASLHGSHGVREVGAVGHAAVCVEAQGASEAVPSRVARGSYVDRSSGKGDPPNAGRVAEGCREARADRTRGDASTSVTRLRACERLFLPSLSFSNARARFRSKSSRHRRPSGVRSPHTEHRRWRMCWCCQCC